MKSERRQRELPVVTGSPYPLWEWGHNNVGQLGTTTSPADRALTPVRPDGLDEITSAAGGNWYTLAVTFTGGKVFAWGRNTVGELGDGTTTDRPTPTWTGISNAISVQANIGHSMALADDRSVWQWGVIGPNNMAVHSPVKVPALTDVYQIAAGAWHSLALRGDGSVWAWGANDAGQLGIGHTDPAAVSYPTPLQVPGLTGITFIAANGHDSFAVDSVGAVWAWGKNLFGTLGDGTTIDRSSPVHLSSLPLPAQAVDVGGTFSMALLNDGTVWTWGSNTWGQLGDSSTIDRSLPGRAGVTHIKRIAAGGAFALAVREDNTVQGWGDNYFGQVGDGSNFNLRALPVTVPNFEGSTWWNIAAGDEHALSIGSYSPPSPLKGCAPAFYRLAMRRRASGR